MPVANLFSIGVGDTLPALTEDLKNGDGTPLVVTGSTVRLHLYAMDGTLVLDKAATIIDGPNGRVSYAWQAADTTTLGAGEFFRKWVVTYGAGAVVSVPDGQFGYLVEVSAPVAGGPAAVAPTLACAAWCTASDVAAQPGVDEVDPARLLRAAAVASDILFLLTGRQFPGVCTDDVRPNRVEWFGSGLIGSVSVSTGQVFGSAASAYQDFVSDRNLGVGAISEIRLPGYPVLSIIAVTVDGVVLPSSAYKINDDRWLTRVDGHFWPILQDITKPPTELGTFRVQYRFGASPGPSGSLAAAAYGAQVLKAWGNAADCSLPAHTRQVLRQGLSVQVDDVKEYLDDGLTGVGPADDFIRAVNPNKLQENSSVFSPDIDWPAHRLR